MRYFAVSSLIATLLLSAPLQATAQPVPAAPGAVTTGRAAYTRKVRADMREWSAKFHRFGEDTVRGGTEAENAADRDLHIAWTHTQGAAVRLENVSERGWQDAKSSYVATTDDLSKAWARVHP